MKASEKQKEFTKQVSKHIAWMVDGNDISSPTHTGINEDEASLIAETFFTDPNKQIEVAEKLNRVFDEVLILIRQVK